MGFERGLQVLHVVQRDTVAEYDVGNIGVEAGAGVFVGEKAYIREFPAEYCGVEDETICKWWGRGLWGSRRLTVSEENDGLGLGMALGLRNVGLETADGFDAAGWTAGVDYTAETAGPHSNVFRHTWIFLLCPFSIVSELDRIGWEPKKKAAVASFWREREIPSELWV